MNEERIKILKNRAQIALDHKKIYTDAARGYLRSATLCPDAHRWNIEDLIIAGEQRRTALEWYRRYQRTLVKIKAEEEK